jgi:3-oxoacyl-[acyl-carrier protein] reductase
VSARHALVTGGSLGIGLASSLLLAREGWSLTLVARGGDSLAAALEGLPGDGHRAIAFDVSDPGAWARAEIAAELHGLVCAAAVIGPIGPIGSYEPAEFARTLEINLNGTQLAIHHCLPALRAGGGSIVTFGGGGASAPLARYDAYAASKAAVVRLTENLAGELAGEGIRINCVAPGFVATRIHDATLAAGPDVAGAEYFAATQRQLAAGGVPAEESAELVVALLDPAARPRFTGKLISARWDPWREEAFRSRLAAAGDLATLRRIDDMAFARMASP